jgi:dihydroflavonol-4-reductase
MSKRGVVLVTGGSGYIAGFCIAQLLEEDWAVRATVRSLSRETEVRQALAKLTQKGDRLSFHAADLTGDKGWDEAVAGCDYVQHVASPLPSSNPKTDDELVIPARDGALRVLRASRDAGVKRVVMTASVACIAYGRGGRDTPHTEADWSDETNLRDTTAYERSKTIAERAAWDWMKREGGALELATVNPGLVLGPVTSADFSASMEFMRLLMGGALPGCPRFGFPLVDVRDVSDLHYRAMLAPNAAGQRYIAVSSFEWMIDVAKMLKAKYPDRRIPTSALPDFMLRLTGMFDPVVRSRLFELGKRRDASSAKARAELGWSPRPANTTVLDTAGSLISQKLV